MAEHVDVVFINAKIATLNPDAAEAEAVAVRGERLIAVGSSAEIRELVGPDTAVVDLNGQRVVPGFVDAHCHPLETIWMKDDWVDARYPQTTSVAETLDKLRDWVTKTPTGEWIFVACVSATENKFVDKRLPTISELNTVAPDNPVLVANGAHMAIMNTAALDTLGIKKGQTSLPKGGKVLLDEHGEHTGVVTDGFADIPSSPDPSEVGKFYATEIAALWNPFGFTSMMAITPHQVMPALQAVSTTVATAFNDSNRQ